MKKIQELYDKVRDKMDYKLGYIESARIIFRFNKLYNSKHERTFDEEYLSRRFYTLGRYLSLHYNGWEKK